MLSSKLSATTLLAASAFVSTIALGQSTGEINGRVVDERAQPIAGARLELRPGAKRIVSEPDGSFAFRNVTPGGYSIVAQRIGYQPRTTEVEVTASGAHPSIVLMAIPAVLDSVRIVERAAPNRFSATVLDESGAPVSDVAVTVEGVSNTLHTDSLGRFTVPSQVRGTLVIRLRKRGTTRIWARSA